MPSLSLNPLRKVAYFCMEVGLASVAMPTYSGGLGVLAGDTLQSAADLNVPMVAVTLLYRKGYFHQSLDHRGNQTDSEETWYPESILEPLKPVIALELESRVIHLRAWQYTIRGGSGHEVPLYLLDAALPENRPDDRALTGQLYVGDPSYRLRQEAVLGLGGVAILRALGQSDIQVYHMNEGHSALLALALLDVQLAGRGHHGIVEADIEAVRHQCVFTTHTPVPAAMDQFPWEQVKRVLGQERASMLEATDCCHEHRLNMTYLGLRFSRYINGVAMRHGEVSRGMFPRYPINSITNGVHGTTWTCSSMAAIFDRYVPEWRDDNVYLRYAVSVPISDIQAAHKQAKLALIAEVAQRSGRMWNEQTLTLGFARRATAYKRADLLFTDVNRLKRIAKEFGGLQILMAGKAHPEDLEGKRMILRIFEAAADLRGVVEVVYLENYDIDLARMIVSGVDVWLNTPLRPNEASGTSGMKAAFNGVPSLSVLDGWWVEGHVEGVTGWSIGAEGRDSADHARDGVDLYDKLERFVLPLYYQQPEEFAKVMRSCIALNAAFFNAHRMVAQYLAHAYTAI